MKNTIIYTILAFILGSGLTYFATSQTQNTKNTCGTSIDFGDGTKTISSLPVRFECDKDGKSKVENLYVFDPESAFVKSEKAKGNPLTKYIK
jgi:hypothetical protein